MNQRSTELVVALDYPDAKQAEVLIQQLAGFPVIFKVGLELFIAAGPVWVKSLTNQGKRVLLDLKFHDIPNTMAKAYQSAARLGVEMLTIHVAAGRAAAQELVKARTQSQGPKLIGVSVLTSFDEETWAEVSSSIGSSKRSVEGSVGGLAKLAAEWGYDGVVCSPHELSLIKGQEPKGFYTLVPGIRLEGDLAGDQRRILTPAQAAQLGASGIVVGRSITQSKDPKEACKKVLEDIAK